MKKIVNVFLVILLATLLSSCFTSQIDVDNAKKDLGIIQSDTSKSNIGNEIDSGTGKIEEEADIEEVEEKIEKVIINPLTEEQFLELDDLSGKDLLKTQLEITGKTLAKVDKIIVTFSNETSDYPTDVYRLKQFKKGDAKFLYRAFSRYETMDLGKNTYLIEAHSGDKVSKLELVLNVFKEEEKTLSEKVGESFENISVDDLPVGSDWGSPIDLGNGNVTYTDLKGLEIKSETISDLTCENLTDILSDRINTWFFWNTCRPMRGEEGISFYVVRLDGDNYVYEKYYYLSYKGILGIQELEKGNGVDKTNIGEKNTELKELNSDYEITDISDRLFKEILK